MQPVHVCCDAWIGLGYTCVPNASINHWVRLAREQQNVWEIPDSNPYWDYPRQPRIPLRTVVVSKCPHNFLTNTIYGSVREADSCENTKQAAHEIHEPQIPNKPSNLVFLEHNKQTWLRIVCFGTLTENEHSLVSQSMNVLMVMGGLCVCYTWVTVKYLRGSGSFLILVITFQSVTT